MLEKKKYKRTEFDRCPKCEGMLAHNSPSFGKTECIRCGFIMNDREFYTKDGFVWQEEKEIKVIRITNNSEKR